MSAFPDGLTGQTERVLFRLEAPERLAGLRLLVQSWGPPDWSHLIGAPGYLQSSVEPNPAVKPFDPQFRAGQQLTFRLRANPTVKTKKDGRPVRQGIFDEEKQIEWLARKGQAGGFRLLAARTGRADFVGSGATSRRQEVGMHRARFYSVQFDGALEVTAPDCFLSMLQGGIGSAKGFGFGLLSVAPYRA